MDPLETQNFRVIAQLAEGGCAGVALETERPERLLESEGEDMLFAVTRSV